MIQTLITNNMHTATRVGWRTGCSVAVQPGESKLVDGAPYVFRNEREEAALRDRVKKGQIKIAYVLHDDDEVTSLEDAAIKVKKSQAKIAAAKAGSVTTAPPAAPAPADPPADEVPPADNDALLSKDSTIEDSKPEVKHKIPGTEDDKALSGPEKTVPIFVDAKSEGAGDATPAAKLEFGSKAAEKLAKEAKLTDAELASIEASGKTGLTKGDVQKFIDSKG
jgi:hypothetical protein